MSHNSLVRLATLCIILTSTFLVNRTASADDKDLSPADSNLINICLKSGTDDNLDDAMQALDEGADINVTDEKSGQTCLMASCLRGKINLVKLLLEKGADVTLGERQGYTPAHGAGFQGRADVMKILKEVAGIDVAGITHEDGFLPLHRACWGKERRHADTVEYLLSVGADLNAKGANGLTCAEMTENDYTKDVLNKYSNKDKEL